jgi:hypothetical protein
MYREFYAYSFENTALAAGTGGVFSDVVVHTDPDAEFEVLARIHKTTSSLIFTRSSDDSYGRYLQNIAVDLRCVSGRSLAVWNQDGIHHMFDFRPFILSCPYKLAPGTTITTSYADNSGLANSIRETWLGAKLRGDQQTKAPWDREWDDEVPFIYTTGPLTVAANGTLSFALNTGMDSNFLVEALTAARLGTCLITIKDGSTDKQWMDRAVHIDNLFGNAAYPHRLIANRFVTQGAAISITIQDISGSTNTVELCFHGTKCIGGGRSLVTRR